MSRQKSRTLSMVACRICILDHNTRISLGTLHSMLGPVKLIPTPGIPVFKGRNTGLSYKTFKYIKNNISIYYKYTPLKTSVSAQFQSWREVVVVADNTSPTKSSTYARFQERREVVVTNNTLPSKSSIRAQFRGRREKVVVADNMPLLKLSTYCSISRAEGGGGDKQHAALEIEHTCSISRAEGEGGGGRQHATLEIEHVLLNFKSGGWWW
jgi:hypothetical protein